MISIYLKIYKLYMRPIYTETETHTNARNYIGAKPTWFIFVPHPHTSSVTPTPCVSHFGDQWTQQREKYGREITTTLFMDQKEHFIVRRFPGNAHLPLY
jgi:hypothetical protein